MGMHLIDEDGNPVIPPLDATINVSSPLTGLVYTNQNIVLQMRNVAFPDYGDYTVSWLVGGQEIKAIPLKVAPLPTPPTTA